MEVTRTSMTTKPGQRADASGVPFLSQTTQPIVAAAEEQLVDDLVKDLLKVVSAGDRPNSDHLDDILTLPKLESIGLSQADEISKATLASAASAVVQQAIAKIRYREDLTGMSGREKRLSEAFDRLFGYSPRTRGVSSTDRKKACWDYYYADPSSPENDYHSTSWTNFYRRKIHVLLRYLAIELMRAERAIALVQQNREHLPDEGRRGINWVQENWTHCYYWFFSMANGLGGMSACVGFFDKFKEKLPDDESLRTSLLGQFAFHLGTVWQAIAAIESKECDNVAPASIEILVPRAWSYYTIHIGHGLFAKYLALTPAEQLRLNMDLDAGISLMELGRRLSEDQDGKLILERMLALVRACQCESWHDWSECILHRLHRYSENFNWMLKEDWWISGVMATVGGLAAIAME